MLYILVFGSEKKYFVQAQWLKVPATQSGVVERRLDYTNVVKIIKLWWIIGIRRYKLSVATTYSVVL